jgi:CheY-like chemotaxis protein
LENSVFVLLIEDEPLILLAAQTALEDGGYMCLSATDGHSGLKLIDENIGKSVAVVTDVRMRGHDGWHLARHARALKPDIPVVYTTGDSAIDWPVHGVPNSIVLTKHYAEAQLLTAVSQLITANPFVPASATPSAHQ